MSPFNPCQDTPFLKSTHNISIIIIMRTFILAFLLLGATLAAIHVRNGRLIDDRGGQLIFHGLNLVSKSPPYHTQFNQTDMQLFQKLGINGLRLGVMWPGVQPKRGVFNDSYLELMKQTVDLSGQYRIYSLVQFHQDLFSQKFCADGVPIWAIPPDIYEGFPRPLNLQKASFDQKGHPVNVCGKHPWGQFYFTAAVGKAFAALWTNKHNLRDLFTKYWMKVASTFKGNEYVIAYELMNQPWPGDPFKNPLVMVPGLSEIIHMQHAYDLIAQGIRSIDADHSICFEPVTWLNFLRAGFSHPPGGRKHSNTSIFCYHYYNPPTFNLKRFMKARMKDIKRLQTGGILSEFYVINKEGQKNVEMMNACDDNLQSWFGWLYNIDNDRTISKLLQSQDNLQNILYNADGTTREAIVEGITRTYAPRVAGTTISQKYDPVTNKFVLVYDICTTCGDTSIFVSREFVYKKGFTVRCFPSDGVRWEQDGQHYIKVIAGPIPSEIRVTVTITAK